MDFAPVNYQMSAEWRNHAAYAQMTAALYAAKWDGFGAWMEKQSTDELEHYRKFRDYLIDRLQTPQLTALPLPFIPSGENPLTIFLAALALEMENTASILALDAITEETEADPERELLETWLIWAKDEQRISERECNDAVKELTRVQSDPAALIALDEKYGEMTK